MRTSKLAMALAVAGALSAGGAAGYQISRAPSAPAAAAQRLAEAGLPDFKNLVEQQGPAVVNISVTKDEETLFPGAGLPSRGQGSGFIVAADGLVLTNAHVVDGASEVKVKLTDRREFAAKVVGMDAKTDIAVLKIEARGLPAVKIGDASALRPGEWVVAIGAPFGFENSVTAGIVSAKGRSLPDAAYVRFIQTDVAVNPGNSGGPLFNLAGEVVGINSQILSQTGGYQGLSFAIPIDIAMNVKDQLVAHGRVTRGYLGVTVQAVSAQLADSFGLERPEGALVSAVEPGSPAAGAGLRPGDVILELDATPVASFSELPARVSTMRPGSAAQLVVWRAGSRLRLKATVAELQAPAVRQAAAPAATESTLGLTIRPLTTAEEAEAGTAGFLVEQVRGLAAKAGLQKGDLLLAANGAPLRSAAQLRALSSGSARHIALLVQRGNIQLFIPVTLG